MRTTKKKRHCRGDPKRATDFISCEAYFDILLTGITSGHTVHDAKFGFSNKAFHFWSTWKFSKCAWRQLTKNGWRLNCKCRTEKKEKLHGFFFPQVEKVCSGSGLPTERVTCIALVCVKFCRRRSEIEYVINRSCVYPRKEKSNLSPFGLMTSWYFDFLVVFGCLFKRFCSQGKTIGIALHTSTDVSSVSAKMR